MPTNVSPTVTELPLGPSSVPALWSAVIVKRRSAVGVWKSVPESVIVLAPVVLERLSDWAAAVGAGSTMSVDDDDVLDTKSAVAGV